MKKPFLYLTVFFFTLLSSGIVCAQDFNENGEYTGTEEPELNTKDPTEHPMVGESVEVTGLIDEQRVFGKALTNADLEGKLVLLFYVRSQLNAGSWDKVVPRMKANFAPLKQFSRAVSEGKMVILGFTDEEACNADLVKAVKESKSPYSVYNAAVSGVVQTGGTSGRPYWILISPESKLLAAGIKIDRVAAVANESIKDVIGGPVFLRLTGTKADIIKTLSTKLVYGKVNFEKEMLAVKKIAEGDSVDSADCRRAYDKFEEWSQNQQKELAELFESKPTAALEAYAQMVVSLPTQAATLSDKQKALQKDANIKKLIEVRKALVKEQENQDKGKKPDRKLLKHIVALDKIIENDKLPESVITEAGELKTLLEKLVPTLATGPQGR